MSRQRPPREAPDAPERATPGGHHRPGGNAILRRGDHGTAEEQIDRVRATAKALVHLVGEGDRILVTHGNGPQVGDILVQNEAAKDRVPQMPLDVCGQRARDDRVHAAAALRGNLTPRGSTCR